MLVDFKNNLAMTRGDTECIAVRLENSDFKKGDKVTFTIRNVRREKILVKEVTDFSYGKAKITILPEDTEGLTPTLYIYDIQITFADGTIKTIIPLSKFMLKEDVTYVD